MAELRRLKAWFDVFDPTSATSVTVGIGSLVSLEGQRSGWVFLSPIGGPMATVEGASIRLISMKSPIGSAMADFEAGDIFEVKSPKGTVDYEILEVL